MPTVNRVPAVTGDEAVDAPPAYHQAINYIHPSQASQNRPRLPVDKVNPTLAASAPHDPDALIVKFQTIVREAREIVVGRLKISTSRESGQHAFILRRYDTGAISVTTMYKAAFPTATNEEEEREMKWIKSSFDTTGMNGSRSCDAVKLAGNWIPPNLAVHLAKDYKLSPWIDSMAAAKPEAGVAYRKSARSQEAADEVARTRVAPATTATAPPTLAPPVSATSVRASPRRAHAAPAPAVPQPGPTPKRSRQSREATAGSTSSRADAPKAEPATADSDNIQVTLSASTQIRAPSGTDIDSAAQIAESKALVSRLKEEALARSRAGESAEDMGLVAPASSATDGVRGVKRTAEVSETETAGIVGGMAPASEVAARIPHATTVLKPSEKRTIASNKRIVPPEVAVRNQLKWGGLMFGAGAVITYLAGQFL